MSIQGFVETVASNQIRGWAYDSRRPSAHVAISVRAGDVAVAAGRADVARADLAAAKIGAGDHGFVIDIVPQIAPAALAGVEIVAISGKNRQKLARVPNRRHNDGDPVADSQTPISDDRQFPVFILGPARSGTSSVALGLLASEHYQGFGEGHLLPLAHQLLSTVDRHYARHAGDDADTLVRNVPVQAFQGFVRRSFVQLARSMFPTGHWLDKTPTLEMVRAAPLMRELWPNARFIFLKRRVIENVMSRQRKFPQDSADRHYSDWIAVMSAWLDVRDTLAGAWLEVDHRQLVLDPEGSAGAIAAFLRMPPAAAIRLTEYVCTTRPEQTAGSFGAIHTMAQLGLAEPEARQMIEACDPVMAAFGYVYGRAYYAGARPAAARKKKKVDA